MNYQTESKFQNWRALAIFEDGATCLLYVGRSNTQVRAGYTDAFTEMLEEEERGRVSRIALQCWQGAADKGHWVNMEVLRVPAGKTGQLTDAAGHPGVLPFRKPAVAAASGLEKIAMAQ